MPQLAICPEFLLDQTGSLSVAYGNTTHYCILIFFNPVDVLDFLFQFLFCQSLAFLCIIYHNICKQT